MSTPQLPDAISSGRELSARHILVVDDNDVNRELAGVMLEDVGAQVSYAENGQEAVYMAVSGDFDAILLDMQMPVLDGHEAARQIRASGLTVPLIAMTASVLDSERKACLQVGCNGYISKPASQQQILTAVLQVLSLSPAVAQSALPCQLDTTDPRYARLVERFATTLAARMQQIDDDVVNQRFARLREHGHWLAGTGPTLGYSQFTAPARELSEAAASQNLSGCRAAARDLHSLLLRLPTK